MKLFLFFSLIILCCTKLQAQKKSVEKPVISDLNSNNQIIQYRMDAPLGVNAEQSVYGLVDFPMTKKGAFRMERSYTKFGNQEQLNAGLAIKYFMGKKYYLIGGGEIQYDINSNTGTPQRELMRLGVGVGYTLDPNIILELGYKPVIGKANSEVLENVISNRKSTFFLRARF
ncbi:hypothetical protein [uncultured Croceitalea sp.]|uniref:hypothetical protein n=1 Tax=uncultured Croceitalea sp. TaxID=1798908 RepID=UPI003305B7B2